MSPPGGHSSNIFGSNEDDHSRRNFVKPTQTHQESLKPQLTPQEQAVLNKKHQQGGSINIFGGGSYDEQPQQQHYRQHSTQQRQQQQQQHEPVAKNRSQRSGFNPITGEDYGADNVQQQNAPIQHQHYENEHQNFHTASRVLQPPGGKSTKLW